MTAAAALASVLPADGVVRADSLPDLGVALEASTLSQPEAVVRPAGVDDVVRVLEWASREGVGVLPVASGRRLRPAVHAPEGGSGRWIALASERLSGIEIYEPADLTLTAGAGTSMGAVVAALEEHGQFPPFDPPAVEDRTLAGLVADGASGPLWTGYGELRNHVLGMTVVTGDGRVLRLGGRVVKNVAGFDLLKPMTGSGGSLGMIVSVCLRAFPRPNEDRLLVVSGTAVSALLDTAMAVGTAPVLPVSCVLHVPGGQADEATLLVRLHGATPTVDADQRTLESHVGLTFEVRSGAPAEALLRSARDGGTSGAVVIEASARPSRMPALWPAVREAGPADMVIDTYGGRVRASFPELDAAGAGRLTRAFEDQGGALRVVRAGEPAVAAAGSRPSDDQLVLTDRLRTAFDPEGVLWPARR
jgi:glycolate oxidase FAD binding subunit